MSADWKQQLAEDLDLVCWYYACPPAEKREAIEAARADVKPALPCFRAMAQEVHRAVVFAPQDRVPWSS